MKLKPDRDSKRRKKNPKEERQRHLHKEGTKWETRILYTKCYKWKTTYDVKLWHTYEKKTEYRYCKLDEMSALPNSNKQVLSITI